MAVRVPPHVHALVLQNLSEAQRIAAAMSSGFSTLASAESAEAAVLRSPTKAELRMAIRGVIAEAKAAQRPTPTDPAFAIPEPAHA